MAADKPLFEQPTFFFNHPYSGMEWVNGSLTKMDKHMIGHQIGVTWDWDPEPVWDPTAHKYRWYWRVFPKGGEDDHIFEISDGVNIKVITVQSMPHFQRWKWKPTVEKTDSESTVLCNKQMDTTASSTCTWADVVASESASHDI